MDDNYHTRIVLVLIDLILLIAIMATFSEGPITSLELSFIVGVVFIFVTFLVFMGIYVKNMNIRHQIEQQRIEEERA